MVFVGTITAALVIKFVVKIFVCVLLSFIDAIFFADLLLPSRRPLCPQDRPREELSLLGWCLSRLVVLWRVVDVLQNMALNVGCFVL